MSYMTVSRRVVQVKVKKGRTQQRNVWTPPPTVDSQSRETVPPLFGRVSPYRRRVEQRPPWYQTWKAILPIFLLPVAALAYAYVAPTEDDAPAPRAATQQVTPQKASSNQGGYASARPSVRPAGGAEMIQMHPMGVTGRSQGHGGSAASAGSTGSPASKGSAEQNNNQLLASASNAETLRTSLEENRKVILPENVAGNCSVAHTGLKELSNCLARSGARAQ